MTALSFVSGDTAPSITGTLTNISESDLAAATVRFQMRNVLDNRYAVDGAAEVISAAAKTVRYDWAEGDLAEPGTYTSRWYVLFADETTEHTAPANDIVVEQA